MSFDFDDKQRKEILDQVFEKVEKYYSSTKDFSVTPELNIEKIRAFINTADLSKGINPSDAINHVINGLEDFIVHTSHPKYFGLYNPRSNYAGIMADLIVAAYNPQMAAWSHAPFAAEVENKIIKELATRFGYDIATADGVFASGGAEANLTAVLCALNHKFPNITKEGVRGLNKKPIIYCSEEAHHSIQRAAIVAGLGFNAVKSIPVTDSLKLDTVILEMELNKLDYSQHEPLMVVGTAGTTGTGVIDDLNKLASICNEYNIWYHVDAAYGGGAILSSKLKDLLSGIEDSDSITFDAHKWMSVPMAASIFITSHKEILERTFRITTEYMPKEAEKLMVVDPYTHSIQWSRRFIGLKVYLSLLFYGWNGYELAINHQTNIGVLLKEKLISNNWLIKNDTELPLVCFTDENYESDPHFTKEILIKILEKGKSWLSIYPINGIPTFRVCITNYNTKEKEIDELVSELNKERTEYSK